MIGEVCLVDEAESKAIIRVVKRSAAVEDLVAPYKLHVQCNLYQF